MATVIQSTSVSTSGIAVFLGTGDTFYEVPGVSVSSTGTGVSGSGFYSAMIQGAIFGTSNGLFSPSSLTVVVSATGSVFSGTFGVTQNDFSASLTARIDGTVYGGFVGLYAGGTSTIAVGPNGTVSGGYGIYAPSAYTIGNAGVINGDYAIYATGKGAITNSGIIAGTSYGIYNQDFTAADTIVVANFGTISGGTGSYIGGAATERLVNQGRMDGSVQLGSHAGSAFINAGTTNGNVTLGSGQLLDSTLGEIFGSISCGTGGDTVVAGRNGGSVMGNVGNDLLYSNATQAAADLASTTTLDGAGGVNALYGGSAYNVFLAGNSNGGYNQIWGGASKMTGVSGYSNNTLVFDAASAGVFVDLLDGHSAYVSSTPGSDWSGTGTYEDSIQNVPNVSGSAYGDVIQAGNGISHIAGGGKADQLYAGTDPASQDTFVYRDYSDSNLVTGYDTIVGFKIGADKIDLSAFHTDASHLALSNAGTANTVYLEQTPGMFNAATDLAISVNATTAGGLTTANFIF